MSDDSYNLVRIHPSGGFTYINLSASDEDPDITVSSANRQFATFEEAVDSASSDYTEYGVSIHAECREFRLPREIKRTDPEPPVGAVLVFKLNRYNSETECVGQRRKNGWRMTGFSYDIPPDWADVWRDTAPESTATHIWNTQI